MLDQFDDRIDPTFTAVDRAALVARLRTILPADGLITDGPYADTKEVFAGYFVIDADNLDQALEWAQRIPAVRLGGAVEVRPLFEVPGEA